MTVALYRSKAGEEFILSRVPERFYIPDMIVMADKDGPTTFAYVGDGKCEAKIAHGPGHQSQYVEWTDKDITAQGVAFH